jgi:hypothetical protein
MVGSPLMQSEHRPRHPDYAGDAWGGILTGACRGLAAGGEKIFGGIGVWRINVAANIEIQPAAEAPRGLDLRGASDDVP